MSSTAIHSLLAIVAPPSSGPAPAAVETQDFERYLSQAATPAAKADKPAPRAEAAAIRSKNEPAKESVVADEQEPLASSETTGTEGDAESDIASPEQTVTETGEEAAVETPEDKAEKEEDELNLSQAALAVAAAETGTASEETQGKVNETAGGFSEEETNVSGEPPQKATTEPAPAAEEMAARPGLEQNVPKAETTSESPKSVPTGKQADAEHNQEKRDLPESTNAVDIDPVSEGDGDTAEKPEPIKKPGTTQQRSDTRQDSGEKSTVVAAAQDNQPEPPVPTQAVGDRPLPTLSESADAPGASSSSAPAPTVQASSSNSTPPPVAASPQSQHVETAAASGKSEPPAAPLDRGRFVQRVANAFRSAQQNDGEIQLRLSPPELGSLKLGIAIRNGVLTAKLEVRNHGGSQCSAGQSPGFEAAAR